MVSNIVELVWKERDLKEKVITADEKCCLVPQIDN